MVNTARESSTGQAVQLPETSRLIRGLGLVIAVLVCASLGQDLIRRVVRETGGSSTLSGVLEFFDIDREVNLPTWFSVLLLASIGGLLLTWRRDLSGSDQRTWGWTVLGFAFLALSIDEFTSLHERLVGPTRRSLNIESGPFFYAWIIPVGLVSAILLAVLVPFLIKLPVATLARFFVAGLVFVAGALLFEMVGGAAAAAGSGGGTAIYDSITSLEEALEMVGAALFLRAVLLHRAMMLDETDRTVVPVSHAQV